MTNLWAQGLVKTLTDTNTHIISSATAVVIRDKYPKAQHHFLVLPKEDIPTIFQLNREHLGLLAEMHLLAVNIIEVKNLNMTDFKIGFHAQPSMQRVHLHVISTDFISDYLKTKKHWNSFNTDFFRPYQDIYQELDQNGFIRRWSGDREKELLSTPIACNQCTYVAKNIPNLKYHLLEHWNGK